MMITSISQEILTPTRYVTIEILQNKGLSPIINISPPIAWNVRYKKLVS